MITSQEIREQVRSILEDLFPEEMVYENLVPDDFQRPSSLVECGSCRMTPMNAFLVGMDLEVKVTLFVEVDPYYHSQVPELERRQFRLMAELMEGYLPVGIRALDLSELTGETNFDYADVTFSLRWQEQRVDLETYPIMEHFEANVQHMEKKE